MAETISLAAQIAIVRQRVDNWERFVRDEESAADAAKQLATWRAVLWTLEAVTGIEAWLKDDGYDADAKLNFIEELVEQMDKVPS